MGAKNSMAPIQIDTEIDVSGATTMQIRYEKPDTTRGVWTATLVSGSTTKIEYVPTSSSIIDQYGVWRFQPYVIKNGKELPSDEWVSEEFIDNLT